MLPGLLRILVTSGSRRTEMAVPGVVPVAELVPGLADHVGLLERSTAYGGYRLLVGDRVLDPSAGLSAQGVHDGAVLTVAAAVDDPVPVVRDDLAEALGDIVDREVPSVGAADARRAALGAACLAAAVGVAMLLRLGSSLAGSAAAVVAATCAAGALGLGSTEPRVASAVWWIAGANAAAGAALLLGWSPAPPAVPGWVWPARAVAAVGLACVSLVLVAATFPRPKSA